MCTAYCLKDPFGLWGHYGLLTASEVKPDLSFKISDPITYLSTCKLLIWYVHFWQPPRLFGGCSDLRFQISDPILPTYPFAYCSYEAATALKQPRRSNLTSDLKRRVREEGLNSKFVLGAI